MTRSMKNILLTLMVFGSFGVFAEDRFRTYNNYNKGYKAMAVGVQLDDYGNAKRNNGYGWSGGSSQEIANSNAIQQCKKFNPYSKIICVLEYSGKKFVYNESIQNLKNQHDKTQKEQLANTIEELKNTCKSYGFSSNDAIASCVQKEINLERDRVQAQQIAKQNQPIIQQAQPNSGPNWDALSNYGRCLGTQGETFSSCSNAWQGYTPPRKTVTKCRYDSFGNVITGTCTTQ